MAAALSSRSPPYVTITLELGAENNYRRASSPRGNSQPRIDVRAFYPAPITKSKTESRTLTLKWPFKFSSKLDRHRIHKKTSLFHLSGIQQFLQHDDCFIK